MPEPINPHNVLPELSVLSVLTNFSGSTSTLVLFFCFRREVGPAEFYFCPCFSIDIISGGGC